MAKQTVFTEKAPAAIGPYSQAVKVGDMVYTSGQLPINMANGELEVNDIAAATKNSLDNVKAILESEGLGMANVIKTTVFMTDLADFAAMNEVYGTYFDGEAPARSCVQVAALPKGAKIEIEAIATK